MSERKVLNKYYPPDFDPSKIPRMKLAKNRQYTVRLMAPFNMRCATCGEYIYKGKKFNARKEDVENEDYLGIRIYRFYIKCTRCLQEISFKTDPKNTDYEIEAGATRNFMALKLAEEQAKKEEDEQKEEEANNPMKLLEYRTEQSRQEIELLESLEELKELNRRQRTIDYESMLKQYQPESTEERKAREEKEDNDFIKNIEWVLKYVKIGHRTQTRSDKHNERDNDVYASYMRHKSIKFGNSSKKVVAEEIIEDVPDEGEPLAKTSRIEVIPPKIKRDESWNRSIGVLSKKSPLANLVKSKNTDTSKPSLNIAVKNSQSTDESKPSLSVTSEVKKPENSVVRPKLSSESIGVVKKSSESIGVVLNKQNESPSVAKPEGASGLTLLANYSDSDSDSQ